ncbi:hypothetical protein AMTRI_Chr04g184840 [Amborella trichopoda]
MEGLTRHLPDHVPWCIFFINDIVLIAETRSDVHTKLELWRDALKSKGFKISWPKMKYIECKFSNNRSRDEEVVKIDGQKIPKRAYFRYLGSIYGKIERLRKMSHINLEPGRLIGDMRLEFYVMDDLSMKLNGKFYRITVRQALLYGTECWEIKKQGTHRLSVAEMRILRWMSGKIRRDKSRNEYIRENLGVAQIGDKMRERRLRCAGHVLCRLSATHVRRCELVQMEGSKVARGRLKRTWLEVVRKDMGTYDLRVWSLIEQNGEPRFVLPIPNVGKRL